MDKNTSEAISQAAISGAAMAELDRLSSLLDTELDLTATASIEEIEDDLREMGLNPHQPLPANIKRLIDEKARDNGKLRDFFDASLHRSGEDPEQDNVMMPIYVYVPEEPLLDECTDEVKLLILGIRTLGQQQRFEEALDLAREATGLAPTYWRGWISLGTLLVLFGRIADGNEIFEQVSNDFAHNPKAVAAGLHCQAWVKEIEYSVNPAADILEGISRLYERALELDASRANTRACLLIHRLTSETASSDLKLLEESVLCEGFFDALRFEINERGNRMLEVLHALPSWLRHLLYPIRPLHIGA